MSKQTWSKRLSGQLSPNEIEGRFEEAARTLRRLPETKPMGYFNTWPPLVRSTWEIMAMEPRPMRVLATPETISRMEECFGWLLWLEPKEARIVWLRAERTRWKAICQRLGISRATAHRWWTTALIRIGHRLEVEANASASKPRRLAS